MPADRKRKREDAARHIARKQPVQLGEDEAEHSSQDEAHTASHDSHLEDSTEEEEKEEEEAWDGLEGGESKAFDLYSNRTGKTPKKPPTGEELRTIKDAAELFMSSSFKLKIDALLPKVRPKYTRFALLEKLLHGIHSFLMSLPDLSPKHPLSASRELLKQGVALPYPQPRPTEDTKWKVAFQKPQDISLVGGWNTKLLVKRKDDLPYVVDIAVEMPDSLFQEKDYLNNRFFHKRAYYLATVAAAFSSFKLPEQLRTEDVRDKNSVSVTVHTFWETTRGDERLTALVIKPNSDGPLYELAELNVQIRIIATLSSTSPIQLNRLAPQRANLRTEQLVTSSSDDVELPTPIYNSILLMHTTARSHLLRMYKLQKNVPAFGDALALLKVWANQRGYGESSMHALSQEDANPPLRWTIRGFEGMGAWWIVLLDYLISGGTYVGGKKEKRRPLGHSLSSYQLFRAVLDFLSRQDWSQDRVFLKPNPEAAVRFSPNEYETGGTSAVFVDLASGVNFLAGVPLTSLEMLTHDAQVTLEKLSENSSSSSVHDPFDETFLVDQRTLQARFDVVIRVEVRDASCPLSPHFELEQGSKYNALIVTLSSVLRTGLGSRAKAMAILHPLSPTKKVGDVQGYSEAVVYIGIILDMEHAYRLVDYGPPAAAESNDAKDPSFEERAKFRALWGPKAELRRFKDGRILESVVWEVSTVEERAHIPFLICQYLLKRHCGIGGQNEDAVQWTGSQWDGLLKLNGSITQLYQATKVQTGFKASMTAFDGLVKMLKSIDDDLPLAILNVTPVSPLLRYTNVFTPIAIPPNSPLIASSSSVTLPACARYVAIMDIVLEFEKSGRWPDDLRAIQKVKMAFLETIAVALGNKVSGLQAQVVLEDTQADSIQDTVRLEILTPEGWAFSARICHDREATLLDGLIDDKPHIPKAIKRRLNQDATPMQVKMRHEAMLAKEVYVRRYIHGPRHHRAVAALSHRHSAYAGTVRLVKRWFASHLLLGGHVQEEAVELICATVFLTGNGAPKSDGEKEKASVPGTKERGFALVARFLAQWEWEDGIFVPIYGGQMENSTIEISPVQSIAGSRQGAWAIRTEGDAKGHVWTGNGPDAVVARRIKDVAKATWNSLQPTANAGWNVKKVFMHPTKHYDYLVKLSSAKAPRYAQNVAVDESVWQKRSTYANAIKPSAADDMPFMPGFDPVQLFFADLQRTYEDTFKIFHDLCGGTTFGIIFDPTLHAARPFRVRGGYNSMPLSKTERKTQEKDKALVTLNVGAVLSEIERMGSGLVISIIDQSKTVG